MKPPLERNSAAFVAGLIVPRRWPRAVILVLASYLDGSNLHGPKAPVVAVGGCVANKDLWPVWEDKWLALRDFADVEKWHHKDFVRKMRKRRNGSYEPWPYAEWLIARRMLCEAFESITPTYVGATVPNTDYQELRLKFPSLPDDPYYFLLDRCMWRLIQGMFEIPIDEGMAVYCDRDKDKALVEGLGEWHTAYLRRKHNTVHPDDALRPVTTTYGSNLDFIPLQGADVVAHEIMRFARANPEQRFPIISDDDDAWILSRLKRQKNSAWFVHYYLKDQVEWEMDGRAWVPGYWPGYRFVAPVRDK